MFRERRSNDNAKCFDILFSKTVQSYAKKGTLRTRVFTSSRTVATCTLVGLAGCWLVQLDY